MIKEDYVSYDVAMLLKNMNFDEPCHAYYMKRKYPEPSDIIDFVESYSSVPLKNLSCPPVLGECTAPTLQMAMKWIRECYQIHIIVTPEYGDVEYMPGEWENDEFLGWQYTIIFPIKSRGVTYPKVRAQSYESACDAALKFILENYLKI